MATTTEQTKVSLTNYTEMLDKRARLKARLEDGQQFLSLDDRSKAVQEFRDLTSQLNQVHKSIKQ